MCKIKFDIRFNAPNARSRQTMEWFGKSIELPELGGWPRGEYEGRIASEVSEEMAELIENADEVPPGVSHFSGLPGKSWNAAMRPLFARIIEIMKTTAPGKRALIVTSGGQLQAIDAFAKAGFDAEFDHTPMAKKPYWSVTGKLFMLLENGLKEVSDNEKDGVYLCEHGETWFNYRLTGENV